MVNLIDKKKDQGESVTYFSTVLIDDFINTKIALRVFNAWHVFTPQLLTCSLFASRESHCWPPTFNLPIHQSNKRVNACMHE